MVCEHLCNYFKLRLVKLTLFIIHQREKLSNILYTISFVTALKKKKLRIERKEKKVFFSDFWKQPLSAFHIVRFEEKESLERTARRNIFFGTQSDIASFLLI